MIFLSFLRSSFFAHSTEFLALLCLLPLHAHAGKPQTRPKSHSHTFKQDQLISFQKQCLQGILGTPDFNRIPIHAQQTQALEKCGMDPDTARSRKLLSPWLHLKFENSKSPSPKQIHHKTKKALKAGHISRKFL